MVDTAVMPGAAVTVTEVGAAGGASTVLGLEACRSRGAGVVIGASPVPVAAQVVRIVQVIPIVPVVLVVWVVLVVRMVRVVMGTVMAAPAPASLPVKGQAPAITPVTTPAVAMVTVRDPAAGPVAVTMAVAVRDTGTGTHTVTRTVLRLPSPSICARSSRRF
ncbi:hypothetical protein GCM10018780_37550 [Streptomyces lanatus]|nr:hypothetical protein GCM10018780_37550 [Streptomyces lanatus]